MKKNPHKCRTRFCRGLCTKNGHSPLCGKCRARQWRERYPLKYAFHHLRNRAKERGHSFSLTFDQYEKFAIETGYASLTGKHKHSLSIDRKENSRGYHADNIRAIRLSTNSRLAWGNMPEWLREEMLEAEKTSRPQPLEIKCEYPQDMPMP